MGYGTGISVSISAIFVVAPLFALNIENATGNILLSVLGGVGLGVILGAFNALVVTYFKVNSFIATLATSFMFFGLAKIFLFCYCLILILLFFLSLALYLRAWIRILLVVIILFISFFLFFLFLSFSCLLSCFGYYALSFSLKLIIW